MTSALHGKSFIAGVLVEVGGAPFRVVSPLDGRSLEPEYFESSKASVDQAAVSAQEAFPTYAALPAARRAEFLEKIAEEILALGDTLLQRAHQETGLPLDRLTGERGRTVGQLRLFAEVVREGSWVDARIDTALPDRKPLAKPDLRRMLRALGPIAVFGSSNFPLAFSVAGGDTASALAAGCPVIVKGHPAHPGTSELVASAITRAVEQCGLPGGVFSMVHGTGHAIGLALVEHPLVAGVGFTGSYKGGRALYDAAARRRVPIPVFAEMSSLNPLFVLPGALRERRSQIVEGLRASVTAGVGQFCTKPGLVFGLGGESLDGFASDFGTAIRGAAPGTMLHPGIHRAYQAGLNAVQEVPGVVSLGASDVEPKADATEAEAVVFLTDTDDFLANPKLHEEVFGPYTLLTRARDMADLVRVAEALDGQLTATLHATPEDLAEAGELLAVLERKVGRLVLNGYPTGVEVCPSMHHGGPFPATTDARFTSVGTAAIQRWARPLCYQNFPAATLPVELRSENERGLMRLVNGQLTRDAVA